MSKTILISDELHSYLMGHGKFGERFEDIVIRLIGVDKLKSFTGDNKKKIDYSKDIDSKKMKARALKTEVKE